MIKDIFQFDSLKELVDRFIELHNDALPIAHVTINLNETENTIKRVILTLSTSEGRFILYFKDDKQIDYREYYRLYKYVRSKFAFNNWSLL